MNIQERIKRILDVLELKEELLEISKRCEEIRWELLNCFAADWKKREKVVNLIPLTVKRKRGRPKSSKNKKSKK